MVFLFGAVDVSMRVNEGFKTASSMTKEFKKQKVLIDKRNKISPEKGKKKQGTQLT